MTQRDRDVRRAWRYFKRALPPAALEAMRRAIMLDVLSTELDHAMVTALGDQPLTGATYGQAYRQVGRADDRRRQIDLVLDVGNALERITRHAWIATALRAAHVPAYLAGFRALQDFLERGFAAFQGMQGGQDFLRIVREREMRLMHAWFSAETKGNAA